MRLAVSLKNLTREVTLLSLGLDASGSTRRCPFCVHMSIHRSAVFFGEVEGTSRKPPVTEVQHRLALESGPEHLLELQVEIKHLHHEPGV